MILSARTLALVLFALAGMALAATLDESASWAGERRHNILSW